MYMFDVYLRVYTFFKLFIHNLIFVTFNRLFVRYFMLYLIVYSGMLRIPSYSIQSSHNNPNTFTLIDMIPTKSNNIKPHTFLYKV